jgi:integrase
MLDMSWTEGCTKTRYPGVFRTDTGFRIRVRAVNPRTGTLEERNREYSGIRLDQALIHKAELLRDIRESGVTQQRQRVGDFAKFWIESKSPTVDRGTAERYVDALENHVLPALGDFYFDQLTQLDVQKWVNAERRKGYRAATLRGWFRVLRTMTRDAIDPLQLPRDPTLRVTFPEDEEREEPNALTSEDLGRFLQSVRRVSPETFALVATLAFTGLRFCHASALRWEDIDEQKRVIRITRKNVRGRVGPVSRKKQAPKQYPLHDELAEVLREQRQVLLRSQAPGVDEGWVFPSETGGLRHHTGLWKVWRKCLQQSGINERFTIHGLRRTFNDLTRKAGVDGIVIRSLTGHVTEKMRDHYSTVGLDEKHTAVASVHRLVSLGRGGDPAESGDRSGDRSVGQKKTGEG